MVARVGKTHRILDLCEKTGAELELMFDPKNTKYKSVKIVLYIAGQGGRGDIADPTYFNVDTVQVGLGLSKICF